MSEYMRGHNDCQNLMQPLVHKYKTRADSASSEIEKWRNRVQALAAIMAVVDGPIPTKEYLDAGYAEATALEDEMSAWLRREDAGAPHG